MDIRKLQRAIVDGLEDVKAQNIAVFNTEHLSSMFERVIIASGTSNRQTKALASSVRESVKSRGMQVMATEGEDNGEWIIVDCGAAVAHIMQPAIREYYHLEEIWGGKSVKLKLGEAKVGLVKASEPEASASGARRARGGDAKPARTSATTSPGSTPRSGGQAASGTAAKPAARAPARSGAPAASKAAATTAGKAGAAKKAAPRPTRTPARAPAPSAKAATAAPRTAARPPAKPAAKVKTLVIAPNKPARKAPAKAGAARKTPAKTSPRSR